MTWFVINIIAFIGTPLGLVFGWLAYSRQKRSAPGMRTNIGLVAISGATLSVALLVFSLIWARSKGLGTTNSSIHTLVTVGVWMGMLAATTSLAARVRALVPTLLASAGSVLLWYGLALR